MDSAFADGVPNVLLEKLNIPTSATSGSVSWDEAFGGPSPEADEAFMAWHYGRYVGRLAEAGKKVFKRPFYCSKPVRT